MKIKFAFWFPAILVLILFHPIGARAQATATDIAYGPDSLEKLDYYRAATPDRPIIILIHAGSWGLGDKNQIDWQYASQMFSDSGYAVINMDYVLSTEIRYVGFPKQPQDVACVISWAKNNAALINGDTSNIVLFGFSAGAHLASLAGLWQEDTLLHSCRTSSTLNIKGVVALSGIYDFDICPLGSRTSIFKMLLDSADTYALAQPKNHIDKSTQTKFLIMHGSDDMVAGFRQPAPFYDSLIAKNYCAQLVILTGRGHDLMNDPLHDTMVFNKVFQFVDSLTSDLFCPADTSTASIGGVFTPTYQIYPNPSNGIFNVSATASSYVSIRVIDPLGIRIIDKSFQSNTTADISAYPNGFYWLQLKNGEQMTQQKIILNR